MYQIVFLDFSMPGMDGPEVATKLIQVLKESNIEKPNICCCTAYSEESFKRKALAVGMDQFMTKPIENAELNKVLLPLKK